MKKTGNIISEKETVIILGLRKQMFVQEGLWHKLSDVFYRPVMTDGGDLEAIYPEMTSDRLSKAQLKAQKEWFGAIAALERLLLPAIDTAPSKSELGLILSAPVPVLSHANLISRFQMGVFSHQALRIPALMPCQHSAMQTPLQSQIAGAIAELPLLPGDPIAGEQFCLALTPDFGLLMVLGEDSEGIPSFNFSFEPEVILQAWSILRSRLLIVQHHQLHQLDRWVEQFAPTVPDYRLVTNFSRLLLDCLPELPTLETKKTRAIETMFEHTLSLKETPETDSSDIELLQALTHEIRTPLTTIRTMTRLLLKRASELTPETVKRLEAIDRECTEQIDRMELIFCAAEFKSTPMRQKQVQLVPISLEQVFQQSIPRWQKQAQRRNVELDVVVPKKLPQVVSDPAMLDRVLTGLMEKFIRSLSTGGQIQVRVTTAGSQLKLQFYSHSTDPVNALKALGQLLMFQPETGSLSLNMDVTKNIFNALGGKLIVRQRPQQGEVLTIFLPLGSERKSVNSNQ